MSCSLPPALMPPPPLLLLLLLLLAASARVSLATSEEFGEAAAAAAAAAAEATKAAEAAASGAATAATTATSEKQPHEAFLGKDEAPEFNKLHPEEAKKKLVELLRKLDTNGDGFVSAAEMENWLRLVAQKDRLRETGKRFKAIKELAESQNIAGPLTLAEYERAMQRELDEDFAGESGAAANNVTRAPSLSSHAAMMERNRKRWAAADANQDGTLSSAEFADFLRPEESPRMRDVVIREALGNTDTNGDGRLDLGEYLKDIFPDYDKGRREGKKLPDWVAREETHFRERLDEDKNGYLDNDEIFKFALPESADHAKAEAQHLFEEADANKDNFLTDEEVLKSWGLFIGHGATNYGAFNHHDEL